MKTTEFKDSELGPIPKEWEVRRLGDVCEIEHGYAFSGEGFREEDTGVVLVTPTNFNLDGGFKSDGSRYFHGAYPQKYVFSAGDLIVTMTDLSKTGDTLGYGALIPNDGKVYLHNQRIGKCVIKATDVEKAFVYWQMRNKQYQRRVVATAAGTTVRHTSPTRLSKMCIPFPPLAEQRRIAEVLGKTDEYIEALKKLIEKRKNVKRGAMQELLTSKRRLPGFEGEWVEKRLGEIGFWCKGQAFAKSEIEIGGKYKCIHYGELFTTYNAVINSVVSRTNSDPIVLSKPGDILFPVSDVTPEGLGRCSAIKEAGVVLGGDLLVLRPTVDIDSEMLSYLINLNKRKIIEIVTGTTVRHVSSGRLSIIEIKIPPTLAEQRAIAKVLSEMDEGIEALEKKLKKVETIKEGMMQDLLTGKVRLKEGGAA